MSSVATMQPAAAIFHEEQYFDWKVYALLGLLEAAAGVGLLWWTHRADLSVLQTRAWAPEFILGAVAGLGLPFLLIVSILRMTTEATADLVTVWYGWLPVYSRSVAISNVRSCEVVDYRPIRDHGGWGVRSCRRSGERALTARGNRGVRLTMTNGDRLLIGSQRPEELAMVLTRLIRTGGS